MATVQNQVKDGLSFGPFNLLVGERLLTKDGAPVELGARAFDILLVLLSTPNEIVSKKDLMSRVWPDVTVAEGSLRFHMSGLRQALGDGKDGARYIATLPGRGYCFVAPVSRLSGPGNGVLRPFQRGIRYGRFEGCRTSVGNTELASAQRCAAARRSAESINSYRLQSQRNNFLVYPSLPIACGA
jgi:DNA-binding winged helix-turn-helix (wHTH) protein